MKFSQKLIFANTRKIKYLQIHTKYNIVNNFTLIKIDSEPFLKRLGFDNLEDIRFVLCTHLVFCNKLDESAGSFATLFT